MERMTWTDERLEDRFNAIDRRFDEVDRRFDRLEGEMGVLRATLNRVGSGIIVGLIGVIAAIFLNGSA